MTTWPFAWPEILTRKGPLGWGLASVACFIIFLLLTFPYGPLQNRLLTELNRASGWEVRAGDWSVGFPAAIEWRDLVFAGPASEAIPVEAVRATVGVFQAIVRAIGDRLRRPAAWSGTGRSWTSHGISISGLVVLRGPGCRQRPAPGYGSCESPETLREPRDSPRRFHASLEQRTRRRCCPQRGRDREGRNQGSRRRTDGCRGLRESLARFWPDPSVARPAATAHAMSQN